VDAAAKAHPKFPFYVFDEFLADVIARLEQDHSLPKQEVRKASVNYALAQIRWLSIWMAWRVSSVMKCFARQDPRSTSPLID
jgi:hypothetical protein